jgi:hypothetical protein
MEFIMHFSLACANCGSHRTVGFYSGQFQTCVRCEDCDHVETRDDDDFEGDLAALAHQA